MDRQEHFTKCICPHAQPTVVRPLDRIMEEKLHSARESQRDPMNIYSLQSRKLFSLLERRLLN